MHVYSKHKSNIFTTKRAITPSQEEHTPARMLPTKRQQKIFFPMDLFVYASCRHVTCLCFCIDIIILLHNSPEETSRPVLPSLV